MYTVYKHINKINNQLIIQNKVLISLIKSLEVTRKRVEHVLNRVSTENKKSPLCKQF